MRGSLRFYLTATWIGIALLPALAPAARARDDRSGTLTFEGTSTGRLSTYWNGYPIGPWTTIFLDSTVVHQGRYAGRMERKAGSPNTFSSLALELPADFGGDTLELRGWLKLENVTKHTGLWQRQEGRAGVLAFDNMEGTPNRGTVDWKEYSVRLPLHPDARRVNVGAMIDSTGTVWLDDLRLLVDGRPLAEAPPPARPLSGPETDHEFDQGSGCDLTSPSPVQIENLVLLGRVWGFLKYHHAAAVSGRKHWDYELFRVLPAVLAAPDRAGAQAAMAGWIDSLGEMPPCDSCAALPADRPVVPRLDWLADRALLGEDLGGRLRSIYAKRPKLAHQFYVERDEELGFPRYDAELGYSALQELDPGYRLLALYRFWNVIEYWSPYRDIIPEDWYRVLRESVPRLLGARTRDAYEAALLVLVARVQDGHAQLWNAGSSRPPRRKDGVLPVGVRYLEGQVVVTRYVNPRLGPATGLQPGDVIQAIDGVAPDTLFRTWNPLFSASNETTRLRDMTNAFALGAPGPARLAVRREGQSFEVEAVRVPWDSIDTRARNYHDHRGPALRRLSDDLAYLTLASVKSAEVPAYLTGAAGAKCLVIDIRNYPSEIVVSELGQHLVSEKTPFAVLTTLDPSNPGSFDWAEPKSLEPAEPCFDGQVAILVDEISQSQSEYTAMAFRARPGALVVGSTTSGTDGTSVELPLPGGLTAKYTSTGIYYPDHRPTQQIGIIPDIEIRPTIAGIRAGRDAVLEAAVRRLLGRDLTDGERAALE